MRTPTPAPVHAESAASSLFSRDFTLLWSGQLVSVFGDFIFNTALIVWIVADLARGQVWAPLAVSGVLIAGALPALALGPVAGVFADRWDKRRSLLAMDAARGVLVLALVPVAAVLPASSRLAAVYATVFAVGACEQLFRPAVLALLGDIVEASLQPRAMGMSQASVSLAMLIGPALAPPLVLMLGAPWALVLNAVSFAVSFATILSIHPPHAVSRDMSEYEGRRRFLRELGTGVRFFMRSRVLTTLMVASGIAMLGGGILNALDIFFTTQNLHTPIALYGLLNTALAVGLIAGALLAGAFAQRIGLTRTLWAALVVLGVLIVVYARLTSFVPAAVVLLLCGIPLAALEVAMGPLLLHVTPRELVGRVSSLLNPAVTLAGLLGSALAGYLDGVALRHLRFSALGFVFGPVDTIYMGAGVLVLIGGIYALASLRTPPAESEDRSLEPAASAPA